MSKKADQTLAVFLLDSGDAARRLLKAVEKIDKGDKNVKIVDAAIADHHKRGRVTVKQTHDVSGRKGGVRGGSIGVIAGAVMLGPPGAAVGGAVGATLSGLYARFRDVGVDDKFMRKVAQDIDRGKSAAFVQYEGDWGASIGAVSDVLRAEHGELIHSTLPADKAAALLAIVAPAVDDLGGEDTVADYEVEIASEVATPAEPAPAAEPSASPSASDKAAAKADDLTQLAGVGPKSAQALNAAGLTTYAALAEVNEPAIRNALQASDIVTRANVSTWPMQASYAAKGDWRGLAKYNQRSSRQGRTTAAKSKPAPDASGSDDLTQISGIGPRMEMLLNGEGVTTYAALRQASIEDLRTFVARGGALPPSSLPTWPNQAAFAMKGDWNGLTAYNKSR
jgi:predicted flap endonuclease-1-like 5' DNA nuclease